MEPTWLLNGVWRGPGEALEASWGSLGALQGAWSAKGGLLEAYGSLWEASGGPFWTPLGVTFWVIFGVRFGDAFFNGFLPIWGAISGSFFESFGAQETTSRQKVQHAKSMENHCFFNTF